MISLHPRQNDRIVFLPVLLVRFGRRTRTPSRHHRLSRRRKGGGRLGRQRRPDVEGALFERRRFVLEDVDGAEVEPGQALAGAKVASVRAKHRF